MTMLETGTGAIHYELIELTPPWVEAPECVLLHHGIGTSADIWAGWLPVLTPRYRILRFDLRGFGRSRAAAQGFAWSLDAMLDDALAVADTAGIGRFHLVGESAGGTLALHAAASRPERLLSATGVSCTHRGGPIRRVREAWSEIEETGLAAWSKGMMAKRFHDGAVEPAAHAWFEREQAAGDPQAVLDVAQLLVDTDLSEALPKIRVPVLLLAPDGSPFVGPHITTEMHQMIPGAELQIFAHARHGLALSHGRECAERLCRFLARR
jgi:3-oxoadipate enol-lactonase